MSATRNGTTISIGGFFVTIRRHLAVSLAHCRPTQARLIGDHYEVKVDGAWTPVPKNSILDIVAPDGGVHVCAPIQEGSNRGVIYCVVLPPET